jgi:hypothetical protein
MARIRSVKPELRTSLTAADWPREVRYFWVLLWGYLDDHGYGQDEPRIIKGDCFPMDDDLTAGDIDKWLDLIAGAGALCRFRGPDGRRYLHAPKWSEHQRPQHPALPKFPACHSSHETLMNGSHETVMSVSGDSHETISGTIPGSGIPAGHPGSGESHESLTLEGVSSRGGEVGVARAGAREPRSRLGATILGNAILDEHSRLVKPSLPRDVRRRTGEAIEELLDDPEIQPDEIRMGLAKLRQNPKLGPGLLSSLVHEIRQLAANPGLANGRASSRALADQAQLERAMQRALARGGTS